MKRQPIHTIALVHSEQNTIQLQTLPQAEKELFATNVKLTYLNTLFQGRVQFSLADVSDTPSAAKTSSG